MFHCPCPIARRNVLGCRTTTFVNHEVAPGVCELRCPCPPTTCKSWCTSFGSLCLACPSRRPPVCKKRIWVLKKPVYEYSFVLIALCGVLFIFVRACVWRVSVLARAGVAEKPQSSVFWDVRHFSPFVLMRDVRARACCVYRCGCCRCRGRRRWPFFFVQVVG